MNPSQLNSMIEFNDTIEQMVNTMQVSYLDAVVLYCDNKGLEYEVVAEQISSLIKERIRKEANTLHLLIDENSPELPI